MDLRLLGSIVILSTVTLTVVRSSTTSATVATNSTTVATTSTTVATTPSQSLESLSTSGTVSLSSSSVNTSSSAVSSKNPSSTSIPVITTSSSVATTTSGPVVLPLSSSFTSAAHTTSQAGSQSVSPTTLSQIIQGTKVLSNTTPSSSVKISVTTKAGISPSAHSPGKTTSKSVAKQQPNSSIGGTTSHILRPNQSDSLTSNASLGVSSQPGPSSVSPILTVSPSLHQESANSTVVTRTTRSFAPTTQALMPSPSTSSRCTEYTVFEKDCSKTCSNVGGQVEATEWCPSYSTVPANHTSKTVQCKDYCSGTEAFRSLLSTVIVGILLFMISQLI